MYLNEMIERMESVIRDIPDLVSDVMKETEQDIVSLNQAQLMDGIGNDGQPLPELVKSNYRNKKMTSNPRAAGRWDMHLNGDTFEGMKVKIDGENFDIRSDGNWGQMYEDGKGENAMQNRGEGRIFGLSSESKEEYRSSVLIGRMARKIAAITGAKLG